MSVGRGVYRPAFVYTHLYMCSVCLSVSVCTYVKELECRPSMRHGTPDQRLKKPACVCVHGPDQHSPAPTAGPKYLYGRA